LDSGYIGNGMATVRLSVPWRQKTQRTEKPAVCLLRVVNISLQQQRCWEGTPARAWLMHTASGNVAVSDWRRTDLCVISYAKAAHRNS